MEVSRANLPSLSEISLAQIQRGLNENNPANIFSDIAGITRPFEWWLFEKYGPTLSMSDLATVLHHTVGTLDQKVRTGQCPVPTYKEGGHRVADLRDVIAYLNQRRNDAQVAYQDQQELLTLPQGL